MAANKTSAKRKAPEHAPTNSGQASPPPPDPPNAKRRRAAAHKAANALAHVDEHPGNVASDTEYQPGGDVSENEDENVDMQDMTVTSHLRADSSLNRTVQLVEGEVAELSGRDETTMKAKPAKKRGRKAKADAAATGAAALGDGAIVEVLHALTEHRKAVIVEKRLDLQLAQAKVKENESAATLAHARAISDKIHADLLLSLTTVPSGQSEAAVTQIREAVTKSTAVADKNVSQLAHALEALAPFGETARLRAQQGLLSDQIKLIELCRAEATLSPAQSVADFLTISANAAADNARADKDRAETDLVRAKDRYVDTVTNASKRGLPIGILHMSAVSTMATDALIDSLKNFAPELAEKALDI